jgi:hypothetical protein
MSSITKPRFWICAAAVAAAFWVTFRVLDADAAPMPQPIPTEVSTFDEIADPALDAMIHRLAHQAAVPRD